MRISIIEAAVMQVAKRYPVQRITLFGSQADGTSKEDSDIDLIVEFLKPISILTLSSMKCELEDLLDCKVDLIHGPLRETDMINVGQEVVLYAA